jgi:hypothetical protein
MFSSIRHYILKSSVTLFVAMDMYNINDLHLNYISIANREWTIGHNCTLSIVHILYVIHICLDKTYSRSYTCIFNIHTLHICVCV